MCGRSIAKKNYDWFIKEFIAETLPKNDQSQNLGINI
jgi:hypothetical protein